MMSLPVWLFGPMFLAVGCLCPRSPMFLSRGALSLKPMFVPDGVSEKRASLCQPTGMLSCPDVENLY